MFSDKTREAYKRVKKGAELLDKVKPFWYEDIDLDTMRMGDCKQCVLGQSYGEYVEGLKKIKMLDTRRFEYGFSIHSNSSIRYQDLGKQWMIQIEKRKVNFIYSLKGYFHSFVNYVSNMGA